MAEHVELNNDPKYGSTSVGGLTHKGGLRKISDDSKPCLSPAHNPPAHISLQPGKYEYTCPSCGKTVTFYVSGF